MDLEVAAVERSSSRMTIDASSMSWWCSASIVRSSALTTRSSAPSAWPSSACSSCWKWSLAGESATPQPTFPVT